MRAIDVSIIFARVTRQFFAEHKFHLFRHQTHKFCILNYPHPLFHAFRALKRKQFCIKNYHIEICIFTLCSITTIFCRFFSMPFFVRSRAHFFFFFLPFASHHATEYVCLYLQFFLHFIRIPIPTKPISKFFETNVWRERWRRIKKTKKIHSMLVLYYVLAMTHAQIQPTHSGLCSSK